MFAFKEFKLGTAFQWLLIHNPINSESHMNNEIQREPPVADSFIHITQKHTQQNRGRVEVP